MWQGTKPRTKNNFTKKIKLRIGMKVFSNVGFMPAFLSKYLIDFTTVQIVN